MVKVSWPDVLSRIKDPQGSFKSVLLTSRAKPCRKLASKATTPHCTLQIFNPGFQHCENHHGVALRVWKPDLRYLHTERFTHLVTANMSAQSWSSSSTPSPYSQKTAFLQEVGGILTCVRSPSVLTFLQSAGAETKGKQALGSKILRSK
jgi:hypothetical protein